MADAPKAGALTKLRYIPSSDTLTCMNADTSDPEWAGTTSKAGLPFNHIETDHTGHFHQCGCVICLARCEGGRAERRMICDWLRENDSGDARWIAAANLLEPVDG